ncbi:MAG: hypothetical protein E7609_02560 [Ruminococcaceae bacterium]|nr:hypothetical protein [Oscillospiraceae bacterium]
MTLISTDGKEFCFLDPGYSPEKFKLPERKGRVDTSRAPFLYCDIEVMDGEVTTKPYPKYHLFSPKR